MKTTQESQQYYTDYAAIANLFNYFAFNKDTSGEEKYYEGWIQYLIYEFEQVLVLSDA